MPTPRKYPDELRERAVRMVFEVRQLVAHVPPPGRPSSR
jgi:transposase-like protein